MKNLAGVEDVDDLIAAELADARIPVIVGALSTGEVCTHVTGELPGYTFTRAWRYWRVQGRVPLDVAASLYQHPQGTAVRAAGHCGAPPPSDWVEWWLGDRQVVPTDQEPGLRRVAEICGRTDWQDRAVFHDNPIVIGARPYIGVYHIDTPDGLDLFSRTIRTVDPSHRE